MSNMHEEDIKFCEEMAKFQNEHKGEKFDKVFPLFRNKLWELAKKYHLNPSDAMKLYMDNYKKFVSVN